ncbi:siderophore-interacting protein [Brevundimonas sp.]|uniref:siderophore-interacting protein n=1 Tax=Brevundimonas sp. TaxID=1871086 RepID=UPI003D0F8A94
MDTTRISRVRHDLRRRDLTVAAVETLTPKMLRVVVCGDDLSDFVSLGYDDHVKLFFPPERELAEGERPPMRDFTPRAYDIAARSLTLDFALHEVGPAADWARGAKVGDALSVGGPRGSMVVADAFDWYLLIGDESALPAIARRLEELPAASRAFVLISVAGPEEEIPLTSLAPADIRWVHRPLSRADDPSPLLEALTAIELPDGEGYCWVAGEHSVARAIRAHLIERPQVNTDWLKAAAYWRKGEADAHEKLT